MERALLVLDSVEPFVLWELMIIWQAFQVTKAPQ
jgi:hypothetical protein